MRQGKKTEEKEIKPFMNDNCLDKKCNESIKITIGTNTCL